MTAVNICITNYKCNLPLGGTNFILRIKEQETRLNLHEHDDDDLLLKESV